MADRAPKAAGERSGLAAQSVLLMVLRRLRTPLIVIVLA